MARLGELCALKWTDFDLKNMSMTVSRTVQRVTAQDGMTKTILLETAPKSEGSKRAIPLTAEIIELLAQLDQSRSYVFGGDKPLEPRTMQYRFKKLLKETDIGDRNFHTLRHTFATNCIENGMDVKALSEILGHSANLYLYILYPFSRAIIRTGKQKFMNIRLHGAQRIDGELSLHFGVMAVI